MTEEVLDLRFIESLHQVIATQQIFWRIQKQIHHQMADQIQRFTRLLEVECRIQHAALFRVAPSLQTLLANQI
ncbi:hypothetical protein PCI56_10585 [Plesiomonas shigelloides subsp. oncorhynchi]|nr:hypothetical protein [Plesiomonas shigelloides]